MIAMNDWLRALAVAALTATAVVTSPLGVRADEEAENASAIGRLIEAAKTAQEAKDDASKAERELEDAKREAQGDELDFQDAQEEAKAACQGLQEVKKAKGTSEQANAEVQKAERRVKRADEWKDRAGRAFGAAKSRADRATDRKDKARRVAETTSKSANAVASALLTSGRFAGIWDEGGDGPIVSVEVASGRHLRVKTANGTTIPILIPPPAALSQAPPGALTRAQLNDIGDELGHLLGDQRDLSVEVLRDQLEERARREAAEILKVGVDDVSSKLEVRKQLRDLVESTLRTAVPRAGLPSRDRIGSGWGAAEDDRGSGEQCECAYCHPLHARGSCPLPYVTMTLPAEPMTAAYAPAVYCAVPPEPRRCFLHHLLSPCAWCHGGR